MDNDIRELVSSLNEISVIPQMLDVVCRTTGMGFAAIARVTETKWITCAVKDDISFGLKPGDELILETTICNEIRQHSHPVVIDNVSEDAAYCQHHTALQYGFQSYISFPIILKDGSFFGTLCAIDPKPAELQNPEIKGMFTLFTDLISFHLNAIHELEVTKKSLSEEKSIAELREQFMAILGHDLRNPLTSVMLGADMLQHSDDIEGKNQVAMTIKKSAKKMYLLVENMLTFARGGKIQIHKKSITNVAEIVEDVINELHTIWPEVEIVKNYDLRSPVNCDANRLVQVFSNLISNAIVHGAEGKPVIVQVSSDDNFMFSVSNQGIPINDEEQKLLFQPYFRGEDKTGKNGLGLGLFISNEIAQSHQGKIELSSDETSTTFTLVIPGENGKDAELFTGEKAYTQL